MLHLLRRYHLAQECSCASNRHVQTRQALGVRWLPRVRWLPPAHVQEEGTGKGLVNRRVSCPQEGCSAIMTHGCL